MAKGAERLQKADEELAAFGKSDEELAAVVEAARQLTQQLDSIDDALERLAEGRDLEAALRTAGSVAPAPLERASRTSDIAGLTVDELFADAEPGTSSEGGLDGLFDDPPLALMDSESGLDLAQLEDEPSPVERHDDQGDGLADSLEADEQAQTDTPDGLGEHVSAEPADDVPESRPAADTSEPDGAGQDEPVQDEPEQDEPEQELPEQELPEQELPEQELPEQELPEQELPEQELPEQELPEQELPEQELPEQDDDVQPEQDDDVQPEQDEPEQELPEQDGDLQLEQELPEQELPVQGLPEKERVELDGLDETLAAEGQAALTDEFEVVERAPSEAARAEEDDDEAAFEAALAATEDVGPASNAEGEPPEQPSAALSLEPLSPEPLALDEDSIDVDLGSVEVDIEVESVPPPPPRPKTMPPPVPYRAIAPPEDTFVAFGDEEDEDESTQLLTGNELAKMTGAAGHSDEFELLVDEDMLEFDDSDVEIDVDEPADDPGLISGIFGGSKS